jgi:hypothetical protein
MTDKRKIKQQKTKARKTNSSQTGGVRDEFRRQTNIKGQGHPAYIYKKIGNKYEFIGITHSEVERGVVNIKIDKNPNPKPRAKDKNRDTYVKPKAETAPTNELSKKTLKGWKFKTEKDKKTIKGIIKKSEDT